jgi:REP element-mobilizing transposase RayT
VGYHPRIESSEEASLLTTRSRNSELWFVNNPRLEREILAYVAKYSHRYNVKLYGLAIEGNHMHAVALFPEENRASYMRDLNSSVARAVARCCPTYPGGSFWARRFSGESLPGEEDLEEYFFYTALQPIKDGLVEKLSDYEPYHFFHDAIHGIKREFRVTDWKNYNAAKKRDPYARIKDFQQIVSLEYERLPGYQHLSKKEYAKLMLEKFETRRVRIVNERKAKGLGFLGPEGMRRTPPGAPPINSKTSTRNTHRPRVLCICPVRKAGALAKYFQTHFEYKDCSKRYRAGDLTVVFPKGTHKPYVHSLKRSP